MIHFFVILILEIGQVVHFFLLMFFSALCLLPIVNSSLDNRIVWFLDLDKKKFTICLCFVFFPFCTSTVVVTSNCVPLRLLLTAALPGCSIYNTRLDFGQKTFIWCNCKKFLQYSTSDSQAQERNPLDWNLDQSFLQCKQANYCLFGLFTFTMLASFMRILVSLISRWELTNCSKTAQMRHFGC